MVCSRLLSDAERLAALRRPDLPGFGPAAGIGVSGGVEPIQALPGLGDVPLLLTRVEREHPPCPGSLHSRSRYPCPASSRARSASRAVAASTVWPGVPAGTVRVNVVKNSHYSSISGTWSSTA